MATRDQVYYNLTTLHGDIRTSPQLSGVDIFDKNLVPLLVGSDKNIKIIKLGIQAPPGTIFCINGENIMIGKTGIYELEHDVTSIEIPLRESTATTQRTPKSILEELSHLLFNEDNDPCFVGDLEYWISKADTKDFVPFHVLYHSEKYIEQIKALLMEFSNACIHIKDIPNDYSLLNNIIIDYIYEGGAEQ